MTLFLDDHDYRLHVGDAATVLATLPAGSVDCIVTSPPYWGLRDYGTAEWEGGDPACPHSLTTPGREAGRDRPGRVAILHLNEADRCCRCGALRVDGQIGLERTHDCAGWATGAPCGACYVCHLVAVFDECWRVLAPHGTLWLNLGDSYASKARGSDAGWEASRLTNPGALQKTQAASLRRDGQRHRGKEAGLKEKDLVGVPWRVALALQAAGWWLRNDNVWAKGNPMPESVVDRASVSHEYVFMLARSGAPLYWTHDATGQTVTSKPAPNLWWFPPPELAPLGAYTQGTPPISTEGWTLRNAWRGHPYYYDAEAVKEAAKDWSKGGPGTGIQTTEHYGADNGGNTGLSSLAALYKAGAATAGRNARTVWPINTKPYPGAHFATFPPELVRRALEAGCPTHVCRVCGAPRERIVQRGKPVLQADTWSANGAASYDETAGGYADTAATSTLKHVVPTRTVGWTDCGHDDWRAGVALDPFSGAGTVAVVARELGRHAVGIELNPAYAAQQQERLAQQSLLSLA